MRARVNDPWEIQEEEAENDRKFKFRGEKSVIENLEF